MNKAKSHRIARLLARHLQQLQRGKDAFDAAQAALDRAVQLGATPGEPITLTSADPAASDQRRVVLIDNLAVLAEKGAIYRPARLPRFLVDDYREPKVKKLPAPAVAAAVAAESLAPAA